ncbi:MAG: hypothetical protein LBQ22_05695 [Bacteroidales bacterium]|jgi:hypothetical protein|nr:hypothetical protein [Bacteroidales bacterium]
MNVYTLGLSKIEVGDIASDGDMGTTLATLGYTYQDTCTMTQDDPETTEHYAEEVDDPVVVLSRAGKTNFNFSVMDADLTTLAALLGGTVTGTGDTAKWNAPDKLPVIEKSVRITPEQGLMFEVPRMKLTSKINATFSKSGIMLIDVVGTVLQPTKTGIGKMAASKI